MTTAPMPSSGGSYIRHPDGSLELVEGSITAPAAFAEPATDPIPKAPPNAARKAPAKE